MILLFFYLLLPIALALSSVYIKPRKLYLFFGFFLFTAFFFSFLLVFFKDLQLVLNTSVYFSFIEYYFHQGNFIKLPFYLSLDGLNGLLLCLQFLVGILAFFSLKQKSETEPALWVWMLILHALCAMAILSISFFWFFVFFELMIIPTYFLIAKWGGEKKKEAGTKYLIYSLTSSVLLLIALVLLLADTGHSLIGFGMDIKEMESLIFLMMFLGFAIKIPLIGLHSWLPLAHYQASTPVSILLAGILLKVGAYGLLRFGFMEITTTGNPFFIWMMVWAASSIVIGACCCLAQRNLKKLVAYSSISQMGLFLVGLLSYSYEGWVGGVILLLSHGMLTSLFFYYVQIIKKNCGTEDLNRIKFKPISNARLKYFMGLTIFSSLGIPGFSHFIGELFVLLGVASQLQDSWVFVFALSTIGIGLLIGLLYGIYAFHRIFIFDAKPSPNTSLIGIQDVLISLSILLLSFAIGIFPNLIIDPLAHLWQW